MGPRVDPQPPSRLNSVVVLELLDGERREVSRQEPDGLVNVEVMLRLRLVDDAARDSVPHLMAGLG